jgi:hypothetical protein
VTDGRNCMAEKGIVVTNANTTVTAAVANVTPVSCNESSDGAATLYIAGSTAPYIVTWPDGSSSTTEGDGVTWTLFGKGTHAILIRDTEQCLTSGEVIIPAPDPVQVQLTSSISPSCFKTATGSASFTATGGTPQYQYELYRNNTLVSQNTQGQFANLASGTYWLEVTDMNNCSTDRYLQIEEVVSQLSVQVTSTDPATCDASADGAISVSASGGVTPYWYELRDNTGRVIATSTDGFRALPVGSYMATAHDANQCTAAPIAVVMDADPVPSLPYTTTAPICPSTCTGKIEFASAPANYVYMLAGVENSTGQFNDLCTGTYMVTIHYSEDCRYDETVTIAEAALQLDLGGPEVVCSGQTVKLSPGLPGDYHWTSPNGFSSTASTVTIFESGQYDLQITTPEGCTLVDSFVLTASTDLLQADLLMADSALVDEPVIAIDLTTPEPETRELTFDTENITHAQDDEFYHNFTFKTPGQYPLQLRVTLAQCTDVFIHTVVAYERRDGDQSEGRANILSIIENVDVFPNPSTGNFTVRVKTAEEMESRLTMVHAVSGKIVFQHAEPLADEYKVDVNLPHSIAGIYLLTLTLANGETHVSRIVLK